jgi:hypothetical protein
MSRKYRPQMRGVMSMFVVGREFGSERILHSLLWNLFPELALRSYYPWFN